jgi:hypothetical protein
MQNNVAIYQNEDGSLHLPITLKQETFWLTQSDIATLFSTSTDNVGLHLRNIYKTKELIEKSTTEHYSVVRKEGNRQVNRSLKHYNLDAILSIGYRVNSSNDEPVINDTGLAALTLLVAQSDPKQKDTLINLIMNMLERT